MKKKLIISESQYKRLLINEQTEHAKTLYRSWAKKKSGNTEAALSIIDDVFTHLNKLPKDFSQYNSYEELKNDLDNITTQKDKSSDFEKIYEDKDLLVGYAKSWEASCKYGAGTKWCTTSKDKSTYWDRHNNTGSEFFWIFKNKNESDMNYKYSYHIKFKGGSDWCNVINKCSSEIPEIVKQHQKYSEIIKKLEEFHNLRPNIHVNRELNLKFISNLINQNEIEISDFISIIDIEHLIKGILKENYDEIEREINNYIDYIESEDIEIILENIYDNIFKQIISERYFYSIYNNLNFLIYDVIYKKYNSDDSILFNQIDIIFNIYDLLKEIPTDEIEEVLIEGIFLIFWEELKHINEYLN